MSDDTDDGPDPALLLQLRERLEGHLVGQRLDDIGFEGLHREELDHTPEQVQASLEAFHADMARQPARSARRLTSRSRVLFMRAAATVLLGCGIGAAVLWRISARRSRGHDGTSVAASAARTYVTPSRQRATVILADGSRVVLAPGSRLQVSTDFAVQTRDVRLEGEAYFTVVHDAARPFAVHTAHGVARDIGTAFNVRAYPELTTVEVAVVEGAVVLTAVPDARNATAASRVLRAADIGHVRTDGQLTVAHHADVASRMAWTAGQLVLDGRLTDLLPVLARWYDLDIRLADPALGARQLTITLQHQSVDLALERVALVLGLQVTRQGRLVTLSGDR